MIGRLDLAIEQNKWLLVAGHRIRTELGRQAEADPDFLKNGKRRDGYRPVEYPVMEALCRTVDQRRDQLFIACFGDVGRYIRERNAARIEILKETDNEIVLHLTHPLDPEVFDLPLTLKLSLKDSGRSAKVSQEAKSLEVTARDTEFIFNVVPNGGEVTIKLH